jgi:aryl-alcohol dehydrogenase
MKTTAAVLREHDAPFLIEDLNIEEPRENEVLVRMVAVGMCHTDVISRDLPPEYFLGPAVLGHEGAGVIEKIGPSITKVKPGDHVVLSFQSCAQCKACLTGHPAYCIEMMNLNNTCCRTDGSTAFKDSSGEKIGSHFFGQSSFSRYVVASEKSLVKVDPLLDLIKLGPLACGIQTGAGAVFNFFKLQENETIVVIGAGAVGMAAIMAAKIAGAKQIVAVDRHQNRLDLAIKYGATSVINTTPDNLTTAILDVIEMGADYVLETTGRADIMRGGFDALNSLGTLGLCGIGFGDVTFDLAMLLTGRTIRTVFLGDATPESFIPYLADLNDRGLFPYDELIQTFTLDQINDAELASRDGSVIKPVIVF